MRVWSIQCRVNVQRFFTSEYIYASFFTSETRLLFVQCFNRLQHHRIIGIVDHQVALVLE